MSDGTERGRVRARIVGLGLVAALLSGCAASADDGASEPSSTPASSQTAGLSSPAPSTPAPRAPAAHATPVTVAAPNPCRANASGQLVRVSLHVQHLWMCSGRTLAYSTPITSGIVGQYTSTPTGDYEIQGRDRHTTLTLITGQQFTVKYWIPFDAPLFGFHDSPWQKFPYGSRKYRTEGSHGCIHMPVRAIRFLYRWADDGAQVHIRA